MSTSKASRYSVPDGDGHISNGGRGSEEKSRGRQYSVETLRERMGSRIERGLFCDLTVKYCDGPRTDTIEIAQLQST